MNNQIIYTNIKLKQHSKICNCNACKTYKKQFIINN